MNITYNNYKFNKHSIAILYNMSKIINKEECFTIVPVFSNRSGTKKAVLLEITKMLKHKIIVKTKKEGRNGDYYIHPTFRKTFNKINFEELKPYPKKLNKKALDILHMIALKSDRVIGREMNYTYTLSAREIRNEFRSFQSSFKEILFPADLIDIFSIRNIEGKCKFEKISTTLIYSSDYEHCENLYKSQIKGFVDITSKGLSVLEENNIYIFYIKENISNIDYSSEEEYLMKLIRDDEFKTIKLTEIMFNNNKEVQFILECKKIKEQISLIKILRKEKKKINFTFL